MKKIFFSLLLAFAVSYSGQAQDAMDTLVDNFCSCLNKVKADAEKQKRTVDFKTEATSCILSAVAENMEALKQFFGEDFEMAEESGEELGRQIGIKAALSCPVFMEMAMQSEEVKEHIKSKAEKPKDKKTDADPVSATKKLVTVTAVTDTPSFTLKVKDETGREESLIVIRNGPGIGDFISNFKQYLGKKITVSYTISEIYNAPKKEFELKKEIVAIEFE